MVLEFGQKYRFEINGSFHVVEIRKLDDGTFVIEIDGQSFSSESLPELNTTIKSSESSQNQYFVDLGNEEMSFHFIPLLNGSQQDNSNKKSKKSSLEEFFFNNIIHAPIPGKIKEILVEKNDKVQEGDVLAILEAMKMENELQAPKNGIIEEIMVVTGDSVKKKQPLLQIK